MERIHSYHLQLARRLTKRVSLDRLTLIHEQAYGRNFGHPFGQFAMILSIPSAFFLALLLAIDSVYSLLGEDAMAIVFVVLSTLAIVPALGLAQRYLVTLAVGAILVKKINSRLGKVISSNNNYVGHLSTMLDIVEREALTLGDSGRFIRLSKSHGEPYFILRITTYFSKEGPSIYGYPRRIYIIVCSAGDNTWEVHAIEHFLFWVRGIRMIHTSHESQIAGEISQWISRIVAIANMKEKRRLQDG